MIRSQNHHASHHHHDNITTPTYTKCPRDQPNHSEWIVKSMAAVIEGTLLVTILLERDATLAARAPSSASQPASVNTESRPVPCSHPTALVLSRYSNERVVRLDTTCDFSIPLAAPACGGCRGQYPRSVLWHLHHHTEEAQYSQLSYRD